MTCTIAYKDGNVIVMGCDSAATDDNTNMKIRKGCQKVWKQGDFIVGFCGNYSELVWIRNAFQWPERDKYESLEHWLIKKVFISLSKDLKKQERTEISWRLLFGFVAPARIILLDQCGDVEECEENFAVIGSASEYAIGCLKALEIKDVSELYSWEKIEKALKIAENYNSSVRGPMHVEILMS